MDRTQGAYTGRQGYMLPQVRSQHGKSTLTSCHLYILPGSSHLCKECSSLNSCPVVLETVLMMSEFLTLSCIETVSRRNKAPF